ncbi:hypothetical protein NC99_30850 [Sunxiuqinia dokdonensis]|uniref:Uncharacterized protein n=1 Tax=Sunxiuqinia dokdonensis TaxID=1409788 RepID=A0A0L8V7B1_9BACT|nr:hypothetical protein NC99_30850 [Sunxiuqinia dokdonensis]
MALFIFLIRSFKGRVFSKESAVILYTFAGTNCFFLSGWVKCQGFRIRFGVNRRGAGCWTLDSGCSILDARCWMLDTGFHQRLDLRLRLPASNPLPPASLKRSGIPNSFQDLFATRRMPTRRVILNLFQDLPVTWSLLLFLTRGCEDVEEDENPGRTKKP